MWHCASLTTWVALSTCDATYEGSSWSINLSQRSETSDILLTVICKWICLKFLAYDSLSTVPTIWTAEGNTHLPSIKQVLLQLEIPQVTLNDASNGFYVTVVIFTFSFQWKNSGTFSTHSACTVSWRLLDLFSFMLSSYVNQVRIIWHR
jgi:hypothetical protein